MQKKRSLTSISFFVFISVLFLGLGVVEPVSANFIGVPPEPMPIYIRSDGTVEPSNSTLKHVGDNNYVLTENLTYSNVSLQYYFYNIKIEKNDVVLDGANFNLIGTGGSWGIQVAGQNNVTIKNIAISRFRTGISIYETSNVNVINSSIVANDFGIEITRSTKVSVVDCSLENGLVESAIEFRSSNSSMIYGNKISGISTDWRLASGLRFEYSFNNSIIANTITNFYSGITMLSSSGNQILGNNFIENSIHSQDLLTTESYQRMNKNNEHMNSLNLEGIHRDVWQYSINSWNSAGVGNYWSNYNGTDANEDGIGDIPYNIDANNVDNYPLIKMANDTFSIEDTDLSFGQSSAQTDMQEPTLPPNIIPNLTSKDSMTEPKTALPIDDQTPSPTKKTITSTLQPSATSNPMESGLQTETDASWIIIISLSISILTLVMVYFKKRKLKS